MSIEFLGQAASGAIYVGHISLKDGKVLPGLPNVKQLFHLALYIYR